MRPIDKRKVSKNREKFSIVSKFLDRGPKKNILYREQGEKRPQTLKNASKIIFSSYWDRHKLILLYFVRGTFFYRMAGTEITNLLGVPFKIAKIAKNRGR